jgi:hypothetical protein
MTDEQISEESVEKQQVFEVLRLMEHPGWVYYQEILRLQREAIIQAAKLASRNGDAVKALAFTAMVDGFDRAYNITDKIRDSYNGNDKKETLNA